MNIVSLEQISTGSSTFFEVILKLNIKMFDSLQKLKVIEILGKILILLGTVNGSGPCLDQDECTFEWILNYRLLT